jgi:hypothetical protein
MVVVVVIREVGMEVKVKVEEEGMAAAVDTIKEEVGIVDMCCRWMCLQSFLCQGGGYSGGGGYNY